MAREQSAWVKRESKNNIRRALTGLLPAVLFASATTISAEVIWLGDFETGDTSQWKGAPKDGVTFVKDPVRAGKYALRIDGTNAAKRGKFDRIEFQHQPKAPGTAEGTERYFGWSVYLPKRSPTTPTRSGISRRATAGAN
jgi:hypothetical protein